jgi:hypothetical protein
MAPAWPLATASGRIRQRVVCGISLPSERARVWGGLSGARSVVGERMSSVGACAVLWRGARCVWALSGVARARARLATNWNVRRVTSPQLPLTEPIATFCVAVVAVQL